MPDVLQPDQLELVRLGGQLGARLVLGDDAALEPLPAADDALHLLLDALEVLGGERVLDVEVVVEAVGDGRADAELRLRVDPLHRLRQDVRGRVAQDVEAVGLSRSSTASTVSVVVDRRRLVLQLAVDAHGDDGAVGEQVESGLRAHPINDSAAPELPPSRQPSPDAAFMAAIHSARIGRVNAEPTRSRSAAARSTSRAMLTPRDRPAGISAAAITVIRMKVLPAEPAGSRPSTNATRIADEHQRRDEDRGRSPHQQRDEPGASDRCEQQPAARLGEDLAEPSDPLARAVEHLLGGWRSSGRPRKIRLSATIAPSAATVG